MNINKIVTGLLAALMLSWASVAYAVDNGTEFGIADDLTVLGNEGTMMDPDVEIKGFTMFGSTGAAQTVNIPQTPGNMYVSGYVQVSSGMYVQGNSTFSATAYFTGVSSFSDVGNIHIAGGAENQVLKKVAGGGMVWADDATGAGEIAGTPRRLVMFQADGTGGANSLLQQDGLDTSITMVSGSSMTILGDFQANGAAKFNGPVTLGDAVGDAVASVGAFTAQNGLAVTAGNASVTNNLTVNGNAQFGNDRLVDTHGINQAPEAGVALAVAGPDDGYAAKFYSGGSLAAWIKKK